MPETQPRQPLPFDTVVGQLRALGLAPGAVVVVHAAFSKVAPVEGGPNGLIDALERAVGTSGTIVMPSMSADDDEVFDPARSPCTGMGIVAETFWARPGVLRSDSPHAFAASGPRAAAITAAHPIEVPHGLDSPVGRVHELDGYILLLGVGHDADTTIHLAENLAGVRYRRQCRSLVMVDGTPQVHRVQRARSLLRTIRAARRLARRARRAAAGTGRLRRGAAGAFAGCGRRRARAAAAGRDRLPASARALRRVRRRARESHQILTRLSGASHRRSPSFTANVRWNASTFGSGPLPRIMSGAWTFVSTCCRSASSRYFARQAWTQP